MTQKIQDLNQETISKHIAFLCKEIKNNQILDIQNPKITFFGSGQCNDIYLLESSSDLKNKKYLCKICTWKQNETWQIKKTEFNILKSIEELNIAPKVFYFNIGDNSESLHWSIVEYIEGSMVKKLTDINIVELAEMLKKLHSSVQFDCHGEQFLPTLTSDYSSSVFEDMDDQVASTEYEILKTRFNQINWSETKKFCLIHNDLKEYNMIINSSGDIKLIDWEYAYSDIPENDIARLFIENSFGSQEKKLFLTHYLPINNINFDMKKLEILSEVYHFFGIHKKKIPPILGNL